MNTPSVSMAPLIKLRLLVAFLGEKNQFAWWDTSFLDAIGFRYLGLIYPNTVASASVNSAAEAACRAHDERIGLGRVAHLFRVPRETESKLRREIAALKVADLEKICSRDAAVKSLDALAAGSKAKPGSGPVQIGSIKELNTPAGLSRMAAAYAHAFRDGSKIFPYFA